MIRPAGYYRVKAKRLRSLLQFFVERYDGSMDADVPHATWRRCAEELLGVHGIGPETADSILLYAGGLPSFVVDAYTHRIFARHGWIGFDADYQQIQEYFQDGLPRGRGACTTSIMPCWCGWARTIAARRGRSARLPACASCCRAGGPLEED